MNSCVSSIQTDAARTNHAPTTGTAPPVSYARGFTKFQKQMFPDQYRRFMTICINHWSRNPYFERRRGARPLPPDEQDFILNALKQVGVTGEMEFDSYEENTNWYD